LPAIVGNCRELPAIVVKKVVGNCRELPAIAEKLQTKSRHSRKKINVSK
jgi:hypothetical protein